METKIKQIKAIIKKDIVMIPIILIIGMILCYIAYNASCNYNLLIEGNKIFGGDGDWQNQHLVFFDYIRNIFWQTGEVYPEFSMDYGSGINFTDLSYYGLMRPEVLVSLLFPQIDTQTWMTMSYFFLYLLGGVLCYKWLSIKTKNTLASFIGTMMYLTCFVLFFESQRHPMFCNWLPWLFLLFIGLDKYKDNTNYKYMIIASVYLLITSMYYYAVGSLIIAGLYTLLDLKSDFKSVVYRVGWMFAGVFLSAFFLFPTILNTLMNARPSTNKTNINYMDLFIPELSFKNVLVRTIPYYEQGPQMTVVGVIAIIFAIFQKNRYVKGVGILTLLLATMDIFLFAFSGFDYVREKTLIPIIPLLCLCIAYFVKYIKYNNIFVIGGSLLLVLGLMFYFNRGYENFSYILFEIGVIAIACIIALLLKNNIAMLLCVIIPTLTLRPLFNEKIEVEPNAISQRQIDYLVNPDKENIISGLIGDNPNYRIDDAKEPNPEIVPGSGFKNTLYSSVLNKYNRGFMLDEMNIPNSTWYHMISYVDDPVKDFVYGTKYIKDKSDSTLDPIGYHEVVNNGNFKILENNNVLPIAYVSYDNISEEQFSQLNCQEKNDALINYGVVSQGTETFTNTLTNYNVEYSVTHQDAGVSFEQLSNGNVKVKSEGGIVDLALNQPIVDNILLIDFDIENIKDVDGNTTTISINNQTNTRTNDNSLWAIYDHQFGYKLNSNQPITQLSISFSKGEYEIANPKTSLLKYSDMVNRTKTVTPLTLNSINQNKLVLDGNVEAKEDGYFITSIPWQDDAFSIYIDGQKVEAEKVNTAFVGAKITKGNHNIVVKYEMPGKKAGIIVSTITLLGIIISPFITKIYRQKKQLSK